MISWGNEVGIAVIAAFVIYLIARNRLGIYLGLIFGAGSGSGSGSGSIATGSGSVAGAGTETNVNNPTGSEFGPTGETGSSPVIENVIQ